MVGPVRFVLAHVIPVSLPADVDLSCGSLATSQAGGGGEHVIWCRLLLGLDLVGATRRV